MSHLLEPIPMERDVKPVINVNVIDKAADLQDFVIGEGATKGEMIYNPLFIHKNQMFHVRLTGAANTNIVIDEYMKKTVDVCLNVMSLELLKEIEGRLPQSQKYKFYSIIKDGWIIRLKIPERHGKPYYLHTGIPATEDITGKKIEAVVAVGLYTSPRNYGLYFTLQSMDVSA